MRVVSWRDGAIEAGFCPQKGAERGGDAHFADFVRNGVSFSVAGKNKTQGIG